MKTAALVYAGSLSRHAVDSLNGGPSAFERCIEAVRSLPGLERILVAGGGCALPSGPYHLVRRDRWNLDALFETMAEAAVGVDALVFTWADQPFIDVGLACRMLEVFGKYRAEYEFADGYPLGLAVEILAPRSIGAVRNLAASLPPDIERGSIFAAIQKDINAFDIETEISPLDLRDLRLNLACDTKRNKLLVERLAAAGVRDAASALEIIPKNLELLRTLPAFIQIQVVSGCPQSCALCPYPLFGPRGEARVDAGMSGGGSILSDRRYMERPRYASLLDQVLDLSEDAVIDISLWGEPSLHPDIAGLVEETLERPSLSLIVETSGIGWDRRAVEAIAAAASKGKGLDWVVSLDAASRDLYSRLRGPGFEEAVGFADLLIELFPGRAHVQMVRTQENEDELETFWRSWKKKTDKVIIQKYSRQAGLLPERKVTDLSPLVRRPCWHLKRDLSVLLDGTVPLCRDFSHGNIVLGNAFSSAKGLAAAWEAGSAYHEAHIKACRSEAVFPEPCKDCDEYYTYNA
jgi:spiro-SPASM protein